MEPLAPRRWLSFLALVSCLVPAGPALASDPAALAEARAWLARMHSAASTGNYQGTMVFSVGNSISSSRVAHYTVGDQTYEMLEALDGDRQLMLRHNDVVQTIRPQSKTAMIERRETLGPAVTTPQGVDPQALEQYDYKRETGARVAGRDAAVILLEPRDALRYAQRLWADVASGLMLRADVIGPPTTASAARQPLESTGFSEVLIGVKPQPELVAGELRNARRLDGYRVVRPQQQRTTLDADGWELKRPVPGFRLAGCVRRSIESSGDEMPVLQVVFTDGLTHVSLFIETYKPPRHGAELRAQHGAAATLTQRRGNHWLTVVGDVPPATLKLFADAIERRS